MKQDDLRCEAHACLAFNLLGRRWMAHVISVLLRRPARFSELVKAIPGISERMLSARLQELVEAELVERRVQEGSPPTAVYSLTPRGESLRAALGQLEQWAEIALAVPAG